MIILGLNAFHGDAAAALVRDGVLVAAAEEERFRRIKHWAGFPSQAIAYCLEEAGVRHIAVNQSNRAQRLRKLLYLLAHPPRPGLVLDRVANRRRRQAISALLAATLPGESACGTFHEVEHHLAHLSSAFHVSPFE
jgi:carbamoyltransferase